MQNMDLFGDAMHICNIGDCEWNRDAVCIKGLQQGSIECKLQVKVPENVVSTGTRIDFSSTQCNELNTKSTSKGAQRKWKTSDNKFFLKERFYYEMRFWNDDLVEVIASDVANRFGFNAIKQQLGTIDGRNCSFSECWTDVKFLPFAKFDREAQIKEFNTPADRIKFALDLIYKKTGLDYKEYFTQMTIIDRLVANEDRHLNNFGVFWNGKEYKQAPLFDFGLGMFETGTEYFGKSIEEAGKLVKQQPFGNWEESLEYLSGLVNIELNDFKVSNKYVFPNKLGREYFEKIMQQLGVQYENS